MRKLAANAARLRVRNDSFCTDAAARVSGSNHSHVINSPYMNHGFIYHLN